MPPFQGLRTYATRVPRALPWAGLSRPVVAVLCFRESDMRQTKLARRFCHGPVAVRLRIDSLTGPFYAHWLAIRARGFLDAMA